MARALGLGTALGILAASLGAGCTGAQGPMGKPGEPGAQATPSVSAVSPPYAYLGRTVDLTIAGSGTSWSGSTTVAFGDPHVKVNKVTAASASGLLVNVTVGPTAAVAPTDVTVTDGSDVEVYKGAFEVRAPLSVSIDQKGGVPQGGFANLSAEMRDSTTPFDPNNLDMTLSAKDVSLWVPPSAGGDYSLDAMVAADVLAKAGESVDVDVTSGQGSDTVDSPAKGAFKVVARAPTLLQDGAGVTGMIATTSDSSLYEYAPLAASTRFVQVNASSPDMGGLLGIVLPKSGKFADALAGFGVRFGLGTTSTDPLYVVVTDGGDPFAPPPYGFELLRDGDALLRVQRVGHPREHHERLRPDHAARAGPEGLRGRLQHARRLVQLHRRRHDDPRGDRGRRALGHADRHPRLRWRHDARRVHGRRRQQPQGHRRDERHRRTDVLRERPAGSAVPGDRFDLRLFVETK